MPDSDHMLMLLGPLYGVATHAPWFAKAGHMLGTQTQANINKAARPLGLIMTDPVCIAQLHWGARSLANKIRDTYEGNLPERFSDMAIFVMRIVSNVCQESNSSAPPGTNVYVR
eukprot:gene5898-33466_t